MYIARNLRYCELLLEIFTSLDEKIVGVVVDDDDDDDVDEDVYHFW